MTNLTQTEVEALLGRSLSSVETSNFDLYLDIASAKVENLICTTLSELAQELGVEKLPNDLSLVVARYFGSITSDNTQEFGVSNKKVEDFSITYDQTNSIDASLAKQNQSTLAKYSHCGKISYGKTLNHDPRYYHDDGFYSF